MRTRFAPSPTGPLHLGHAFAAIYAHDLARAAGGQFLLRIEDIDQSRARPEWEQAINDDLGWLGLSWDGPVLRQSERSPAYHAALQSLWARGLLYPCTCTRRDIVDALGAPQEGAATGPDGPVYPGTCRGRMAWEGPFPGAQPLPKDATLRLDMERAAREPGVFEHRRDGPAAGWRHSLGFHESGRVASLIEFTPEFMVDNVGDVVVARRDFGAAYHLAVVVDDAAQGITHVTRGEDMFDATRTHVVLQRLLGLPTPVYHHHRLIRDDSGKRLAKRDDARAIRTYRDEGATPADIRRMVGL